MYFGRSLYLAALRACCGRGATRPRLHREIPRSPMLPVAATNSGWRGPMERMPRKFLRARMTYTSACPGPRRVTVLPTGKVRNAEETLEQFLPTEVQPLLSSPIPDWGRLRLATPICCGFEMAGCFSNWRTLILNTGISGRFPRTPVLV